MVSKDEFPRLAKPLPQSRVIPRCVVSNLCIAIGFNVESVVIKNVNFQVWDLGGQSSIR